jgi:hypothetical protein
VSYNYSQYFQSLITLLVAADQQGQANLQNMMPNIIDYAEQRIYRELDLLTTFTTLTATCTPYLRFVQAPPTAIVIESENIITPANTAPDNGTRNQLRHATKEFIDSVWPTTTTLGISPSIPKYSCLMNNNSFSSTGSQYTLKMVPPPDAAYVVEFNATIRPLPLSSNNSTTFLTTFLPDLFLAASMIFSAGYQRDFGAAGQVDDENLGVTWEKQYQSLKSTANVEELRKKWQSTDWSAYTPSPLAERQ